MTVPNEAKSSWRARFVCLWCAGLLAFAAGGRTDLVSRRRASETIGVPHRSARWPGAGGMGSRGSRSSHFWPGVCSAGPWLEGQQGKPKGPALHTPGQR